MSRREDAADGPAEIALVGELSEHETDIHEKLLGVEPGGECLIYFNSPGGGAYTAMSLMSLIAMRGLRATGVVTGECSSAALWPFAACRRRLVTPYSVLLFHPLKWESEEHVGLAEAAEWARHFAELEVEMDKLLATFLGISIEQLLRWTTPGRYLSGREFAAAGLAELVELQELATLMPSASNRRRPKGGSR